MAQDYGRESHNAHQLMQAAHGQARKAGFGIYAAWHDDFETEPVHYSLFWASKLTETCNQLINRRAPGQLIFPVSDSTIVARVEAGVRLAAGLFPFAEAGRLALWAETHDAAENVFQDPDIAARHSDAIATWHKWLWLGPFDDMDFMTNGPAYAFRGATRLITDAMDAYVVDPTVDVDRW